MFVSFLVCSAYCEIYWCLVVSYKAAFILGRWHLNLGQRVCCTLTVTYIWYIGTFIYSGSQACYRIISFYDGLFLKRAVGLKLSSHFFWCQVLSTINNHTVSSWHLISADLSFYCAAQNFWNNVLAEVCHGENIKWRHVKSQIQLPQTPQFNLWERAGRSNNSCCSFRCHGH